MIRVSGYRVRLAGVVVIFAVAAGCNGPTVCPQGYLQDDPLIHVREAQNSASGASIPQLTFSEIKIDGRVLQQGDMQLFLVPNRARNVTVDGAQLLCTVACDFSAATGDFEFIVSAPGYQSKTVTVADVRPTQFERKGACTVRAYGGVDLSIVLDPS